MCGGWWPGPDAFAAFLADLLITENIIECLHPSPIQRIFDGSILSPARYTPCRCHGVRPFSDFQTRTSCVWVCGERGRSVAMYGVTFR